MTGDGCLCTHKPWHQSRFRKLFEGAHQWFFLRCTASQGSIYKGLGLTENRVVSVTINNPPITQPICHQFPSRTSLELIHVSTKRGTESTPRKKMNDKSLIRLSGIGVKPPAAVDVGSSRKLFLLSSDPVPKLRRPKQHTRQYQKPLLYLAEPFLSNLNNKRQLGYVISDRIAN